MNKNFKVTLQLPPQGYVVVKARNGLHARLIVSRMIADMELTGDDDRIIRNNETLTISNVDRAFREDGDPINY